MSHTSYTSYLSHEGQNETMHDIHDVQFLYSSFLDFSDELFGKPLLSFLKYFKSMKLIRGDCGRCKKIMEQN